MHCKRTRNWSKCSTCRKNKIRCSPSNRDWEVQRQRCEPCEAKDLECGPNYKKKDDPELAFSGQDRSESNGLDRKRQSHSLANQVKNHAALLEAQLEVGSDNGGAQGLDIGSDQNPEDEKATFDAELRLKAISKLENFNALGIALSFALGFSAPSCPLPFEAQAFHTTVKAIKEELHLTFINLTTLGLRIASRGNHDQAQWILTKLLLAMEKYPGLYDSGKKAALLKIALFFQEIEDYFEFEYVLSKVASIHGISPMPDQGEDPCSLLAQSYPKTSQKVDHAMARLWDKAFAISNAPPDLCIPPLQRALQLPDVAIASGVLSHLPGEPPRRSLFNQHPLHVAATNGKSQALTELIASGADVETRDINNRTPFFLAAMNGHTDCCQALLYANADPQSTDGHGHTIMEVAARAGHFDVVKLLVVAKAELNPFPLWCCSTPLQAAVESTNPQIDLISYLIEHGADVTARRIWDQKSAFEIAKERGLTHIAQFLHALAPMDADDPFLATFFMFADPQLSDILNR